MKKSMSIVIQVIVLLVIAMASILYIMDTTPVEHLGEYEKTEMAKPNKTKSMMDTFFKDDRESEPDDGGNHSLTGETGRYDAVRIGKSSE